MLRHLLDEILLIGQEDLFAVVNIKDSRHLTRKLGIFLTLGKRCKFMARVLPLRFIKGIIQVGVELKFRGSEIVGWRLLVIICNFVHAFRIHRDISLPQKLRGLTRSLHQVSGAIMGIVKLLEGQVFHIVAGNRVEH